MKYQYPDQVSMDVAVYTEDVAEALTTFLVLRLAQLIDTTRPPFLPGRLTSDVSRAACELPDIAC
jgi:hypothetical protein